MRGLLDLTCVRVFSANKQKKVRREVVVEQQMQHTVAEFGSKKIVDKEINEEGACPRPFRREKKKWKSEHARVTSLVSGPTRNVFMKSSIYILQLRVGE